ncbi:FHA domain-containing protein [Xylella fastidiosa]|nr:FHA domain-containing protein [Xylella fastidiosa]MDS9990658.1 FHA domain-containing protein [Xylella fastidiosa]
MPPVPCTLRGLCFSKWGQTARLPVVSILKIHFSQQQQPDHTLSPGVHRIVRHASGVVAFADEVQGRGVVLAQFSLDNRGLWLQVAKGIRGIHVNGRPVRRMAWLRVGDAVYADGVEMLVIGIQAEPPDDATATLDRNCLVLRGVGGRHYGRSFTLEKPRIVGQEAGVDIWIDDPVFAARHAVFERHGDRVLLRDLGSEEGSVVNGCKVRDAWLQAGDQIVLDGQHRFVLESPLFLLLPLSCSMSEDVAAQLPPAAVSVRTPHRAARWPWLLLSALLLATALGALLWFDVR